MIHNHGPEEGEGLACNELRLPDGSLKGKCLMTDEEKRIVSLAGTKVPLVDARVEVRKVVGEVEINDDGTMTAHITDEDFRREMEPPAYSFSMPFQAPRTGPIGEISAIPLKSLDEVIQEGLVEMAEEGKRAVEDQFEKDSRGGMEHFKGISGILRDQDE